LKGDSFLSDIPLFELIVVSPDKENTCDSVLNLVFRDFKLEEAGTMAALVLGPWREV